MNIFEIKKYKGFYKFLSILKNNKEESLNMLLDGYTSTNINEEENYLELYYTDGKAKITCEPFEVKGLINKTEYKYNIKLRKEKSLASIVYESNRNKAFYNICTKDENSVNSFNGEITSKKGNIESILGSSKAFTYRALYNLKPSVDFENEPINVVASYVNNFPNRYIPTYEDTFDLAVFGEYAFFKYNGVADETTIKDYDKEQGIKVAFNSYINGDLRPADAVVNQKNRTLR